MSNDNIIINELFNSENSFENEFNPEKRIV